jgi:DNA repair protein RadC
MSRLDDAGSNRPPLPFSSTGPHGHRRRMRERLLGVGAASLADYELLEMLLFLGIARRDTKPLAKSLINSFGSLAAVLSAPCEALSREGGLSDECVALIRLPELAAVRLSAAEARDRPVLNNWERLLAYFETALTGAIPGQLRILFLDNRNRLLADEVIEDASTIIPGTSGPGTSGAAPEPDTSRLAMRRALDLHATALLLVRVVPPGPLAKPALAREAALGARLAKAASPLAIVLHDHMLVGGDNWVSLRQKGLL